MQAHDERWTVFPRQTQKMNFTDGRQIANRLSQQNSLVASGSDICGCKCNCDYFSLTGCRMSAVLCVQGLGGQVHRQGVAAVFFFFFLDDKRRGKSTSFCSSQRKKTIHMRG